MLEFDENFYLAKNPDVAHSVQQGKWQSGFSHYCVRGKKDGRVAAPSVDEEWYKSCYPVAREEIQAGLVASSRDHYFRIGRARGYLPYKDALRPDNASATHSKFGGLWIDAANAIDVINGRLELGLINNDTANLLFKFATDGYVILENAISDQLLSSAEEELDNAFRGKMPSLKFDVHNTGRNIPWVPSAVSQPAKALDIHWHSSVIRDLIFSSTIRIFLESIFERRALATQTLGFYRGSAQDAHQDSAYVLYSLPLQFAASWIALEDVQVGAGELYYHVGSHRMAEFQYGGSFKGADLAKIHRPSLDLEPDYSRHIELISKQTTGAGLSTQAFLARRGDVLIWNADLAHGGRPISLEQTRKSVVTHYCPKDVAPLYFEARNGGEIKSHSRYAFYSSSCYDK